MSSLSERAKKVWAQGFPGTNSKRFTQYPSNAPKFLTRAQGPYVWDESGKKYIDFVGALGAIILGHNHPKVTEGVQMQLSTGYVSGSFPHPIEIETAELIQEMFPACEKIRFLKNGDDATRAAVRIARAFEFEDSFLSDWIISDGYHGAGEIWTSMTPPAIGISGEHQIIDFNENGIKLVDNDQHPFIFEPIQLDASDERKNEILEYRKKCKFIIFDEIITGCRVPSYSVHKWWNLKPDIVCLGKAIANGFPLSVVGGKKEIMDAKEYFISTTFSGEAISLAACKATLTELKIQNINELWFYANRFQNKFNEICKDISVSIQGYGTRGSMDLTNPKVALFCQEALKAGMLFGKAFFFNFSHLENHIEDYIFDLIFDIVSSIKSGKVTYQGELPKAPFVR